MRSRLHAGTLPALAGEGAGGSQLGMKEKSVGPKARRGLMRCCCKQKSTKRAGELKKKIREELSTGGEKHLPGGTSGGLGERGTGLCKPS